MIKPFKPPKPRIFSGEDKDTDPAVFDAWKHEVIDYLHLLGIEDDKTQVTILQYLVCNTAKDYYTTRREGQTRFHPLKLDDILDGLRQHVVPSTHGNEYWKQWEAISQMHDGCIIPIGLIAIEIDRLTFRIGEISKQFKLHRFLSAMHPELRLQVEPTINKANFVWTDVVKQAEKDDDALRQAGKYDHEEPQQQEQQPGSRKNNNNDEQQDDDNNTQQKDNRTCFYCGRPGHLMAQCYIRIADESNSTDDDEQDTLSGDESN